MLSVAHKTRIVYVMLLVLAFWPLVQIWLVIRFDADPWKLAGWGMYAAPKRDIYVEIAVERDGRLFPYDEESLPRAARPAARALAADRAVLGELRRPERLATTLFRIEPDLDAIEIAIAQIALDPRSGLVERRSRYYRYTPP